MLADTSVWIHHFRVSSPQLEQALIDGLILMHPFVLGEIVCGNLRRRSNVLSELQQLPSAVIAEHEEVLNFVEQHRLFGSGIGWIDAHLLASARLTGCRLWTLDTRLRQAASKLRLVYSGLT
jgi:predicted nucleic acid-binding protein